MSAPPPDTRPPILSDRDIALFERLAAVLATLQGGARVNVTDARVSKAIVWLLVAVGTVTLSVGGWLITDNIAQGKLMERVVTILEQQEKRITKLEERRP